MIANEVQLKYELCPSVLQAEKLTSSNKLAQYARTAWDEDNISLFESFKVILLSNALQPLGIFSCGAGGTSSVSVNTRGIYQVAILSNAVSLALVHNHPSGEMQPSKQDQAVTSTVKQGCDTLGITLIDHIIISPTRHYSFADNGLI